VSISVTLRNYFRHCQKLHTSQQRQRPIQYAHARNLTMAAAFGPDRAAPDIRPNILTDEPCVTLRQKLPAAFIHRVRKMRPIVFQA